jgi:hypothetical protein
MRKLFGKARTGMTTFYLLAFAAPAFGQAKTGTAAGGTDVEGKLTGIGNTILGYLTGDVAKIIISCAFAGSCIAYAVNKNNDEAKQKLLAVIIATVLLGTGQWIVGSLLTSATA